MINETGVVTTGVARGVRLIRDGKDLTARLGTELREGDRIVTDSGTRAVIGSEAGPQISLRAGSEFTVRRASGFLHLGSLLVSVNRLFRVESKFVVAGVEGTEFSLSVDSSAVTAVEVLEGKVRVESTLGKWVPRSYAEGEECVARGEAEPLKGSMDDQARERLLRWRQDFGWPVGRDGSPGSSAGKQAGTLMVSGTGGQGYSVWDASGKERLTYDRPTNSATELVAGTYTVVLNESRQRVEVPAGKQTVVRAGTLMVSGTGGQGYSVWDASGKERLTYDRPTNSVTELVAGTYTVVLNESRQRVEVPAGKETVVRAGTLMVSGTGRQGYSVWDASGKERLTYDRPTNSVTELVAGTYTVVLNESRQRVEVPAGKRSVVQAGTLMVSGTGGQGYSVFDASGKERLTYDRPTNSATELVAGTYTVVLNESRQRIEVPAGKETVVQAGTLMVSGTGGQGYSVFDASGKERLTYDRPTNSATELVAGTYTVVLNESRQRIEVPAGKETVVRAGTLMVSGTSGQGYSVWDASGKERLTYDRHINSITELLPGMYMIKVGEKNFTVSVKAGDRATVTP